MKALEILKEIQQKKPFIYSITSVWCRTIITNEPTRINEAIAELEALQQRSCEECVHRSFIDEALTNKVTNGFCIENGFFTKRDFCCNRYEAKDQK